MEEERTAQDPRPEADPEEDPGKESDEVVLSSPAQFKALGHPVRHRMVNVLRQRPATLSQLSSVLGLAKGTAGYHVRVLREAGLVRLAETRQVRGGTEQYFALVSESFRFHKDFTGGSELLFNAALAEMLPTSPGQARHTVLRHLWLTPDEAHALVERLKAQAAEPYPTDSSRGEAYGMLLSLYRADIPNLSAEED
ncbi:hypothetical protein GCM10010430_29340 [Kitasatospora cystarginea]|uniref:HTH arsR-type domain-containing protein n=1 Tax=Kitasatospora cystarginea TaxID=58350 RepID=A0ABN3E025_9ACTN